MIQFPPEQDVSSRYMKYSDTLCLHLSPFGALGYYEVKGVVGSFLTTADPQKPP